MGGVSMGGACYQRCHPIYLNDLILRDIDPHKTNWFEHIKDSISIRMMAGAGLLDHH